MRVEVVGRASRRSVQDVTMDAYYCMITWQFYETAVCILIVICIILYGRMYILSVSVRFIIFGWKAVEKRRGLLHRSSTAHYEINTRTLFVNFFVGKISNIDVDVGFFFFCVKQAIPLN